MQWVWVAGHPALVENISRRGLRNPPICFGMTEDGGQGESSNKWRGNPGLAGRGRAHRRSLGYARDDK
jgi:hypothetical protein